MAYEAVEDQLEGIIDLTRDIGVVVCDYQNIVPLHKKMNELVGKLQELDRVRKPLDIPVPVEVFSKIDAGQNPQLYIRECMERALAKNEAVRGQIDTLARFRHLLMVELSTAFPDEMRRYRLYREEGTTKQK